MVRPYNLLESVLVDIEKGIRNGVKAGIVARRYMLSEGHLRRLFRLTYKQTLADYIRRRRLKASLDDLLNTGSNLLDIAIKYGFLYEQSYIRAFKREFGTTPGCYRRSSGRY